MLLYVSLSHPYTPCGHGSHPNHSVETIIHSTAVCQSAVSQVVDFRIFSSFSPLVYFLKHSLLIDTHLHFRSLLPTPPPIRAMSSSLQAPPDGDRNRAAELDAVAWSWTALSSVVVASRVYSRLRITRNIWWDDYFIILTFVRSPPKQK